MEQAYIQKVRAGTGNKRKMEWNSSKRYMGKGIWQARNLNCRYMFMAGGQEGGKNGRGGVGVGWVELQRK